MKTIILQQPGQLAYSQSTAPAVPATGHAVVRVRRIGVCGTDLHAFRGRQPFFTYPRILGHELGVEIAEPGPNDLGLKVGDRCAVEPYLNCGHCIACRAGKTNCCTSLEVLGVHADGGMQESISVPLNKLHRSATLSCDQLAVVEPLSIGAHAVERAQLQPEEFVLVIGAGPIGLSVIQFAQLKNARVIALDVSESRLDFCRAHYRMTATINAQTEDVIARLNEITNGDLPTAVFDATGNVASMQQAFNLVAHGGRLIFVGLVQAEISFHDPNFHRRELTVLSSRNSIGADFKRIIAMMESGQITIDPWITHRVPFTETVEHFSDWLNPEAGFIKGIVEL